MINNITSHQFATNMFMQEKADKQNNNNSEAFANADAENAELEKELTNKKAAERRAKLMNQIWGDAFLSDSLH